MCGVPSSSGDGRICLGWPRSIPALSTQEGFRQQERCCFSQCRGSSLRTTLQILSRSAVAAPRRVARCQDKIDLPPDDLQTINRDENAVPIAEDTQAQPQKPSHAVLGTNLKRSYRTYLT